MKTCFLIHISAVDSRGAGGARAPPEFWGSEKGRSLIPVYPSLAITMNTTGFKIKAIYGADIVTKHMISSLPGLATF